MHYIWILVLLFSVTGYSQSEIAHKEKFSEFLNGSSEKSLLILGENHGTSAGAKVYAPLVMYLNQQAGVTSLLVEFGPAEAYFYNRYLESGDEKHLNYTVYAGAIKEWRDAWRKIYNYNKSLEEPLVVKGIDFDRTRTFAYAFFSIVMQYEYPPAFLDGLLKEIRSAEFFNTYTVGYPSKKDIEWMTKTKKLLINNRDSLYSFISTKDKWILDEMLNNEALSFAEGREEAITKNTMRIIENSDKRDFFLLIGRSHAYLDPLFGEANPLAKALSDSSAIRLLTGIQLYENSELTSTQNKPIILFEITDKTPWSKYHRAIMRKGDDSEFTIIRLVQNLKPLAKHVDYIMVSKNQKPYKLLNAQ